MPTLRSTLGSVRNRVFDTVTLPKRRTNLQEQVAAAQQDGRPVMIHIGSGRASLPGWIDTDIQWRCPAYLDATVPWPLPADTVDFVYGDNVVEHLTLAQGRLAYRHAFDAMRPGGVMRLATPDAEASARNYLNGAKEGMARNVELGHQMDHPVQALAQVWVGAKHYLGFVYDYSALSSELEKVGFEVRRVPTGQSDHAELRNLELRTHPAEAATQLVVEAVKPS